MAKKVGSFFKGLMGDHATLDQVLAGKVVDKKYRLIDLQRANVSYNPTAKQITIHRPKDTDSIHVPVREAFHDYMEKYGNTVRYVTRNGTPWLTDAEKGNPKKVEAYFAALKAGPKKDVAMINWQKTDGQKRDTGHAAISVGELALGEELDDFGQPIDPRNIEDYEQHAGGSFYPSASMWRDRKTVSEGKLRDTGESDPSSHARGVLVRNTIKPTATAAAAGAATAILTSSKKKKGGIIRTVLRAGAVAGVTYTAGFIVGSAQSSPGSIRIKDEKAAHGVLATLISPSQHDILEHTLVGLSRTYHGKYNVMRSNCADFSEDMMGMIGLDTHELVQTAMETEPVDEEKHRKKLGERAIPYHIRPDRFSWAMKQMQTGEQGRVSVDEQEINMQKFEISGQSALLIEAADGEHLKHPPLEMLGKVLAEGVGLTATKGPSRAEFAFGDNVRTVAAAQGR